MVDKSNTPDEIVDVVNEKDEVVGQSTKGVVNSDPSFVHREIGVLIYNSQGKILIQQRSAKKTMYPLWWIMSVAGHVKSGQTYEQTAHMELQEELGFDTNLVFYHKEKLSYPDETHFASGFLGKIPDGITIKVDPTEIEDVRFVSEHELEGMVKKGDKIDQYSLKDFRKFFGGEFDKLKL
ncbi:MAG: NUDIX domain-containing protein [Patescibacteria group bacterium]